MKKYFIYLLVLIVVFLGIVSIISLVDNKSLKEQLYLCQNNEKALISENDSLKNNNIVYKLKIDQLDYFNDSITLKLNKLRRELNIRDKNLKQLQYLLAVAEKKDSIIFRDTIFRDAAINIDTTLADKWYKLNLELNYPNKIVVTPSFTSEKCTIFNTKKEIIGTPKKCFLLRWFQKRQEVVEVEIIEKNPYIKNKESKFIEIIE